MRPSTSRVASKNIEVSTTGWLDSDDDNDDFNDVKTPLLDESMLKQQQKCMLKGINLKFKNIVSSYLHIKLYYTCIEQDDGLNELASIVTRQKNIAITISSEVDLQNGL